MGDGQRKFLGDEGHWPLQKGISKEGYGGLYQGHDKVGVSFIWPSKTRSIEAWVQEIAIIEEDVERIWFFFGGGGLVFKMGREWGGKGGENVKGDVASK